MLTIRQKEVLTGSVILLLTVGSFTASELAVRLQQVIDFGTTTNVERSKKYYIHEETGLRLPVAGSTHGKLSYNCLGFRGPEIDMPKPEERVRVVFLGSSTTLDPYAGKLENSWPYRTCEHLREAFPDDSVDCVNGGVPGLGSEKMLIYYESFIRVLQPDIVVILANDQNRDLDKLAAERGLHEGTHYKPSWLAQNSLFWAKVEKNISVISRQRTAFRTDRKLNEVDPETTYEFREHVIRLIETLRRDEVVPVLLSYDNQLREAQPKDVQVRAAGSLLFFMPYMSIGGLLEAHATYNEALEDVARETDVSWIDWRDVVPGDPEHFTDSSHLSMSGSRLLAIHVSEKMSEDRAVRERFRRQHSNVPLKPGKEFGRSDDSDTAHTRSDDMKY